MYLKLILSKPIVEDDLLNDKTRISNYETTSAYYKILKVASSSLAAMHPQCWNEGSCSNIIFYVSDKATSAQ